MKSVKNILVVACMLGTLLGYANGGEELSLVEGTKKVKVAFEDVHEGEVLIVRNQNGEILHREVISHDGNISKVFDFSNLENGNYEIDLNKDSETLIKPFAIKDNELVFKKESKSIFHRPLIQTNNNIVKVSKLFTEDDSAEVIIYYNDLEVFTEQLNSKSDHLSKLYKLKDYDHGTCKVIVHTEGKSYTKEFKL